MPPILPFLLRLLTSAVVFTIVFRLAVAPLDRVSGARPGQRQARGVAALFAFLARLALALVYASYVAALVTHWTHRPDVTFDWFYYLLAGSVYFGPFALMGKAAEARGAVAVMVAGGAALLLLCLMPGVNLALFGGIWVGVVDSR